MIVFRLNKCCDKFINLVKFCFVLNFNISLEPYKHDSQRNDHDLRAQSNRIFDDSCKLKRSDSSFHIDSAKLWNASPLEIKSVKNINLALICNNKHKPSHILR